MGALETLRRREWTIAAVRWAVAAFVALQPLLGREGSAPWTISVAVGLSLLGVGVAVADRRLGTATAWRQVAALMMALDGAFALVLVASGVSAGNDDLWAVLTLVSIEGALRYRLRGALIIAAGTGLAYVLIEGLIAEGPPPGTVTSRLLLLLIVGGFAGAIARELDVERRLFQRIAWASQDIVAKRDPGSILQSLAAHVAEALDAHEVGIYRYPLTGWTEVLSHRRNPGEGSERTPLLKQTEGGVSAVLHRVTWRPAEGDVPNRLTLPIRLPERPAEYVVVAAVHGPRPTAVTESALLSLAESTAVSLATRDLIRNQETSNRRLQRLEGLRTRFVATVAHDLRSPLTTVKSVASILRDRRDAVPPEVVDRMLESVSRQANRLNRLADDLLDAARLDSEMLELKLSEVDLGSVLRSVAEDADEPIELRCDGGLNVRADGPRLERVVWNLVSNAIKYGKPPFEVTAEASEDGMVRIDVRDHGKGLSPTQMDRLFTDFAGNDDPDSVGLGLAIVWQLVDAHGGTVTYSPAEPGARFSVLLPVNGSAR